MNRMFVLIRPKQPIAAVKTRGFVISVLMSIFIPILALFTGHPLILLLTLLNSSVLIFTGLYRRNTSIVMRTIDLLTEDHEQQYAEMIMFRDLFQSEGLYDAEAEELFEDWQRVMDTRAKPLSLVSQRVKAEVPVWEFRTARLLDYVDDLVDRIKIEQLDGNWSLKVDSLRDKALLLFEASNKRKAGA